MLRLRPCSASAQSEASWSVDDEIAPPQVEAGGAEANNKYSGVDLDAYNWAKENANDPRAAAILEKLGGR